MHLVAPLDKHFPLLYVLLKDHIADDVDYKVCFPIYTYINFFFGTFASGHIIWLTIQTIIFYCSICS